MRRLARVPVSVPVVEAVVVVVFEGSALFCKARSHDYFFYHGFHEGIIWLIGQQFISRFGKLFSLGKGKSHHNSLSLLFKDYPCFKKEMSMNALMKAKYA
jgi:hypothetical protein